MQIVIDISESEYFLIKRSDNSALADCVSKEAMMFCIKNGTPIVETVLIPILYRAGRGTWHEPRTIKEVNK